MTSIRSARRLVMLAAALWFLLLSAVGFAEAQPLVPAGSVWKYLDTGVAASTGWSSLACDDSAWRAGPAQLGYGDGDESTVVRYGSSSQKHITTYFRHTFTVTDASSIGSLDLRLVRDDGAVVYLNGTEILRSNMPGGSITSSTLAISALDVDEESTWLNLQVPASPLLSGLNVIAVEIHQANAASSDISFDLALSAGGEPGAATLVRGPYVQMGTPTSMVLRWRTDRQTPSAVDYGQSPDSLPWSTTDPGLKTEHAVVVTGLQPDTTYYYAVGTGSERLAGGDDTYAFATSPPAGTAKPTRIWVIGDSGTADANAAAVRDGYQAWTAGRPTDFWLTLGDNAYEDGTDTQYQAAVFEMYSALLRTSVLWPSLGNHDAISSSSATQTGPYFNAFTLPSHGEAGGAPSGTEAYYSFDYGSIHVVVLDSADSDRSPGGAMATWLRNDLAQNTLPWTIAIFHHAPYSRSSHNSDWDLEMSQMRENLVPILEQGGVDLVLAGHGHAYERSFLIDGHYQDAALFSAANVKDGGNGREDGTGMYRKSIGVPHQGTVYAVVGCSGDPISSGSFDHPAMLVNLITLGSMVIDVNGLRLDATFIDAQGVRRDYFTIWKDTAPPPPPPPPPPAPPTYLTALAQSTATVSLAWLDQASDETAFEVERKTGTGAYAVIALLGASTTNYTDTGLAAATTYSFRVRALRDATPSAWSNVVTVKTKARPDAPSALTAAAQSRSTVTLNWADRSDDETGFQIQRSTNGSTFTNVAKVGSNVTSYAVGSLKANTKYYFRVRAYRDGRNSTFSNTATATTPR